MAQEVNKVEVSQVNERCPKCNNGYMISNGIVYPGNPVQWEHICNSCGFTQNYGTRFPYIMNQ